MIVQVLAIELTDPPNVFDVSTVVDGQPHQFTVAIESAKIGDQTVLTTSTSDDFQEVLRWGQAAGGEVLKLVIQVYNGVIPNLPTVVETSETIVQRTMLSAESDPDQ
jgi:hypothetical protein